jgi:hypothetical protein
MRRMIDLKEWPKLFAVAAVLAGAAGFNIGCDDCGDRKEVVEIHVLDGTDWYYELETPDAEKDCHAKFKLEIAWNNRDRKKDGTQLSPFIDTSDLRYEFRADGGTFTLFQIGPQKDSQPDGSGGWTYWWYWTDDVGAKNEPHNPTHYKIAVSAPGLDYLQPPPDKPTWWQVWVRATIDYVPWDQEGL